MTSVFGQAVCRLEVLNYKRCGTAQCSFLRSGLVRFVVSQSTYELKQTARPRTGTTGFVTFLSLTIGVISPVR